MTQATLSSDEIRQMVRSILKELLPTALATRRVEPVNIASDSDLARFVTDLVRFLDDPITGAAVRAGNLVFSLKSAPVVAQPAPLVQVALEKPTKAALGGAITERKLLSIVGPGENLMISADAVVTPLARDKARALGITFERRP